MRSRLLLLMAGIFFTALLFTENLSAENDPVVTKATVNAYVLSLNDDPGIFLFDLKNPGNLEMKFPLEANEIASAGTYANGKYYAMILTKDQKPIGLFAYDLQTGLRTLVNDMSDAVSFFIDMTYDYTTSSLYALWYDYPNTTLLRVNTEDGSPTLINIYQNKGLYAIAADITGQLYVTSSNGYVYSIDKTNNELVELFSTEIYGSGFQSMDFDLNSGRLYWIIHRYGNPLFYEIDLAQQSIQPMNNFPSGYQMGGLHTAFTNAVSESPAAIDNLSAQYGEDFLSTLKWTNPTLTLAGEALPDLLYAEVYRNDTLVDKLTNVSKGGTSEWTDLSAPNKINKYKIITYTSDGKEGFPAWISSFSGQDVPGNPTNVEVSKLSETSASITWEAPTNGLHDCWFDRETLTYKIVRQPDNTVLAEQLSATTYTDENVTEYSNYTYQIIALNAHGEGGSALSSTVSLGESIHLPFTSTFLTEEDFNLWSVYNRDDTEASWSFGQTYKGEGCATSSSYVTPFTTVDNWLVSPPLYLEKGIRYELSFKAYTAYYNSETFRITLGTAPDPEAQTITVKDLSVKNYYGESVTIILPEQEEDGNYYLGIQHYAEVSNCMMLQVNNLQLKEQDKGSVNGTITTATGPIANVTVTLNGNRTYTGKTDADGKYDIKEVIQGEYVLKASVLGYEEWEENITVTPEVALNKDITLETLPQYKVQGVVNDSKGNPVSGATIILSGYNYYRTSTDGDGAFKFDQVYQSREYKLEIKKNNFESKSNSLIVESDVQYDPVQLVYKNLSPYTIEATMTQEGQDESVMISWNRPVDLTAYAYDNDQPSTPIGYDIGRETHILGTVYREATTLYRIKWYTMSHDEKKPFVHVYIIDLDEQGNPTGEMLFSQKEVPTEDDQWTTFELPERVSAPRGFMIALSGEGNINLAKDDNPEIVGGKTQCYSTNYAFPDGYTYFEDAKWTGALMLRAEGEAIEKEEHPINVTYNLWRLAQEDKDHPDKWTQVVSGTTDRTLKDNSFHALPMNTYLYAVSASYPVDNLVSEKVFSNPVYHQQFTDVTFNINTNSVPEDAEGALIKLDDVRGNHYQITVTDGKASLPHIWKGIYTLTLTQAGFEEQVVSVDLSAESEYELSYTLVQIIAPVSNLDILPTEQKTEWKLMWDLFGNIEDGFESEAYEDFEINPVGNTGWQYIDNDGLETYGFGATTFPNMRAKMAAILFNSNTTEPPLAIHTAHSGDRALAFFAARETEDESGNIVLHTSDDYLISPELNFHKDFTFSFYARSYNDENGLERIRVGYSTTDTQLNSFTYIDKELISVPTEYTKYTYVIPKEAKYVVLNSSSPSAFILLVDDIFIGTDQVTSTEEPGYGTFDGYKVYVDNVCVATTQENNILLTGLTNGDHTASVTKVYKTGESAPLSIDFHVDNPDGINEVNSDFDIYVTPENKLILQGAYKQMKLFTATGTCMMVTDDVLLETDLNHLDKGVYIISVMTVENRNIVRKIVLK